MNATTKTAQCVWAFLMFAALEPARAFYDPGTQRWLTRDPIGEPGFAMLRKLHATELKSPLRRAAAPHARRAVFSKGAAQAARLPNRYLFVHNNSLRLVDPLGLEDDTGYPENPWQGSAEYCADLLNRIEGLGHMLGRNGIDNRSVLDQMDDLLQQYEDAGCDDDGGGNEPCPKPVPAGGKEIGTPPWWLIILEGIAAAAEEFWPVVVAF